MRIVERYFVDHEYQQESHTCPPKQTHTSTFLLFSTLLSKIELLGLTISPAVLRLRGCVKLVAPTLTLVTYRTKL